MLRLGNFNGRGLFSTGTHGLPRVSCALAQDAGLRISKKICLRFLLTGGPLIVSDINGVQAVIRFDQSPLSGNAGLAVWIYASPDSSPAYRGNWEGSNLICTPGFSLTGPPKLAGPARIN